jgi:hypothetical protein
MQSCAKVLKLGFVLILKLFFTSLAPIVVFEAPNDYHICQIM